MEKFTPSELCADIKIYDYKQKVKYDEKSLVIFEKTGKMITAGKECEGMLYALPANSIGFSPIVLGRVSDYTCAEKMLKQMLCRYLGKASFTGYGAGVWMWQMKWIGDFGEISVGLLMRKIRRVL